jgi:hypothetical protein
MTTQPTRLEVRANMQLTKEQIRDIFMAHGFTIKEGQTDLKQYVYDAAFALLSASKPATPAHCQCAACKTGTIHASDCAVHGAPALPVGECDCGAAAPAQSAQPVAGVFDTNVTLRQYKSPEPTLRECVHLYYKKHGMNEFEATNLTREYFEALGNLSAPQPSPTAVVMDERAIIRELQKALFYWMPSIAGEDSPAGHKAAEHSYLLVGLDDNSLDCYGDQMRKSLAIANQALERIAIACRDAGCPDEMDMDEFISSIAPRSVRDDDDDGGGPDFEDGPDEEGFKGPRPWNGFNGMLENDQTHSDALAGDINPRGKQ